MDVDVFKVYAYVTYIHIDAEVIHTITLTPVSEHTHARTYTHTLSQSNSWNFIFFLVKATLIPLSAFPSCIKLHTHTHSPRVILESLTMGVIGRKSY